MNNVLYKSVILIILIFVALVSYIDFSFKKSALDKKIIILKLDIESLKNKIETFKKELESTLIINNLANNIITTQKKEDFLLFITLIAKDYKFPSLTPTISIPKKIEFKKNEYFDLVFTKIMIDFKSESEIKVYTFIDELIEKIPGYLTIKSIRSTKKDDTFLISVELHTYTLTEH